MIKLTTYGGYKVTERDGNIAVFDPRFPRNPAIFRADTMEAAERWIDAYRDGAQWAVEAYIA